jgi:hypothetical protein
VHNIKQSGSKGVSMSKKINDDLISEYKNKSIEHRIDTKLEININIAGTDFNDIGEAINHAYRCGLAAGSATFKKSENGSGAVDQDELYKVLKYSHSPEHKADFLREIAKEWFPIEVNSEKKIKTVNLELNELADFLKE